LIICNGLSRRAVYGLLYRSQRMKRQGHSGAAGARRSLPTRHRSIHSPRTLHLNTKYCARSRQVTRTWNLIAAFPESWRKNRPRWSAASVVPEASPTVTTSTTLSSHRSGDRIAVEFPSQTILRGLYEVKRVRTAASIATKKCCAALQFCEAAGRVTAAHCCAGFLGVSVIFRTTRCYPVTKRRMQKTPGRRWPWTTFSVTETHTGNQCLLMAVNRRVAQPVRHKSEGFRSSS
jgi:hypothetical protein